MGLNGIDISGWQDDLVVSNMATCDFVIVKATGGRGYANGCFRGHADATLAAGKLLDCYHYARDRGYEGTAEQEADWFVAAFGPYIGRAIPFLDWEADAVSLGVAWAKAWLDRVRARTGVTPGIYASKSVLFSYDWSSVARTYPLWVAQYPNYDETGFKGKPWTDGWDFGAWDAPLLFQYTSSGRIPGYGGRLDLDLFYGDAGDWLRRCAVAGDGGAGGASPSGSVDELARRVIAGEFGNGDARREALGGRYDEVQAEVNRILSGGSVDVDDLARRVIAGEFGNGDARERALGSNYAAVQRRVNEMLGVGSPVDIDALARAVIRGDYGNGEERRRRLGSSYAAVQKRVNQMLS